MIDFLCAQGEKIWGGVRVSRFYDAYRRFFNLEEIENDIALKWLQGAVIVGFFITFLGWFYNQGTTVEAVLRGNYTCWPFWQDCGKWHVLSTLPYGYSQPIVYMVLFGFILLIPYLMYLKEWTAAHFLTLLLLLAKTYFMAINYGYKANYDYYQWLFAFIFVFLPHKRFFTQLTCVMFYFLSTSSKISPAWVLGSYFTTMQISLPIFPKGTEAFFANLVIFEEMFGAWFLFSSNRFLQRTELLFYIAFHLYSSLLVGYFYPTIVLPVVLIVFGPWFVAHKQVPLDAKSIAGWLMAAAFVVLQAIPVLIPGNERLTNEGNFYGLYMFESNHQCAVTWLDDTGKTVRAWDGSNARDRCDAYKEWFVARNRLCRDGHTGGLRIDHSINGGPFYRIVDEPNICTLRYKSLQHNAWIKDEQSAPVVGYPRPNIYH